MSLIKDTIRTVSEENIDDNDEYLNIKDTTTQVKINKKLSCNDRANKIPRYVATPFPPRNLSQIGNMCPKKTIIHDKCKNSGKYFSVMITGKYPFNISNKRVRIAKNLFPVRRTFVAPIFPDPIFLISIFPKIFPNIKPKGMEPLKYENKITNIISIN